MIDAEGRGAGSLRAQLEGLIAKWRGMFDNGAKDDGSSLIRTAFRMCADDLESILSSLKDENETCESRSPEASQQEVSPLHAPAVGTETDASSPYALQAQRGGPDAQPAHAASAGVVSRLHGSASRTVFAGSSPDSDSLSSLKPSAVPKDAITQVLDELAVIDRLGQDHLIGHLVMRCTGRIRVLLASAGEREGKS